MRGKVPPPSPAPKKFFLKNKNFTDETDLFARSKARFVAALVSEAPAGRGRTHLIISPAVLLVGSQTSDDDRPVHLCLLIRPCRTLRDHVGWHRKAEWPFLEGIKWRP
jgi:hypothetical protein